MRVRTAKQRAQRIDLDYFKRPHGLRWWRFALSVVAPVIAIVAIGGYAAAGSRRPYSAGPVSNAHAFAERRCGVCHVTSGFRAHVTDAACMSCHDGPPHGASQAAPPACAACHQEHGGRVQLAKVDDRLCISCHGTLAPDATSANPHPVVPVNTFPGGHPEFAVLRNKTTDPGGLRFNHATHLKKEGVRGPNGPEQLQCGQCHRPEVAATVGRRAIRTGLMAPVRYQQDCARCHTLYFDEKIDAAVPHDKQSLVRATMRDLLERYIAQNPRDITNEGDAIRRVPLNFPRPPEPPARNAAEWVTRRLAFDERVMWNKTCAQCHVIDREATANQDLMPGVAPFPRYLDSRVTARWMPRASFDHAAHQVVRCQSCHAADTSRDTADVLMPSAQACATCHAPSKGAESRCFECHQYHDWAKARPVTSTYSIGDFK